jgi:hypothetical protein
MTTSCQIAAGVLLLAWLGTVTDAQSQIGGAAYAGGEWDHADVHLYHAGVALQPAQLQGWGPAAGIFAFALSYPEADDRASVRGVTPSVGIRHQWPVGAIQGSVGYSWVEVEGPDGTDGRPVFGGTESGVALSASADYWGTGAWEAQAIVSGNVASEYIFGRLRGARTILPSPNIALGGELVLQGNGDYSAFQAGPLLHWRIAPQLRLTAGGGYKSDSFAAEDGAYGRVEAGFFF